MRQPSLALLICLLCNGARGEEGVPASCEGLDNIASADNLDCVRTADCLSETCNVTGVFTGYGATLNLFPCHRPPALELLLISPEGTNSVGKFDSSTPSRTTSVPLNDDDDESSFSAEFRITVSWATTQTALIMSEIVGTNNFRTSLLDPTNVTLPACKPAPRAATTCLALQQIAADADKDLQCTTNRADNCDTITCTPKPTPTTTILTQFQVLPCNNVTPALHMKAKAGSTVLIDTVLTKSTKITISSFTVNVTLEQLNGAIGLQVDLLQGNGSKEEILRYSEIPIDKTECTEEEEGTDALDMDGSANGGAAASHLELTTYWLLLFSTLVPPLHFIL